MMNDSLCIVCLKPSQFACRVCGRTKYCGGRCQSQDALKHENICPPVLLSDDIKDEVYDAALKVVNDYGDYEAAEKMFLTALSKESTNANPRLTINLMRGLSCTYAEQDKYDVAKQSFDECLAKSIEILGRDHMETLDIMNEFGDLYVKYKKYDLAEPILLDCFERRDALFGENYTDTINTMYKLGVVFTFTGRYAEAVQIYIDCIEKRKILLSKNHPITFETMMKLAELYMKIPYYTKAVTLLYECFHISAPKFGSIHPHTIRIMKLIVQAFAALGKDEEVDGMMEYITAAYTRHGEHELAEQIIEKLKDYRSRHPRAEKKD